MGFCSGCVDYLTSYETPKQVRVRDWRLGLLRFGLTFMIGCYIIIWELAGKNGWTVSSAVSGVSRLTIQQPTLDDCEPTAPGCTNTLAPLDTLPYCAQSELEYAFDKYPCNYYVAPFPAPQLSGAVIAVTRTATANQTLECDVTVDATCPIVYESSSAPSTYVANIEAFTLGLDHSAYAMMPDGETIVGSAAGLVGILKSSSDKQCAEHPATDAAVNGYPTDVAPCYIVTNRTSAGMDLIRVDMLLEAAGASLDAANNGGGSSGKPYRNTGAMLIVNVQYSNIRPWGAPSNKVLHYEYDPVFLEGGSYKAFYTSYEEFRSSRVLVSSHGINVEAAVSGTFHGWDFQAFLVTITASFTLLAGVSVLIEFFAMYLAPDAQKFSSAKYEEITLHSASEFHAMTTDFAGGVAGGIGAAAGGVAGGLGAAAGGIAGATGLGGRRTSAGPAPQAAEISDRDSLNAPLV